MSPSETLSETNCEEGPLEPESSMTSVEALITLQTGPPTSISAQGLEVGPESQSPKENPNEDDMYEHDVVHQEEFRKGLPDNLLDDLL